MVTDISHLLIMGENVVTTLVSSYWIGSSSFLQVIRATIKAQDLRELTRSDHGLQSLMPLSVWKTSHRLIMGEVL